MSPQNSSAPFRRTSHLKSGLVAGALGLTALSPISEASAASVEGYPGGALYFGYNFGGENSGFAWGLEAYADFHPESPNGFIFGPSLRIGFVNLGSPQITVAGRLGGFSLVAVAAEGGMAFRFGERAGFDYSLGVHSHFVLGGLGAHYLFSADELMVAGHVGLNSR